MIRSSSHNGIQYVSVTSAMRLVKTLFNEPPDYFGPLGSIHAAEGEWCHRYCLDWLATAKGWLPEYHVPLKPEIHPDQARWDAVMYQSLGAFQEFVKEYQVDPIGIEQEDFSKTYGLVGHIDLPCYLTIPGRRRMKAVMDLKFTSAILETHKLQVRCYSKLDGMKGCQIGGIFQCNRDTGVWKFEQVNLNENLDDVLAVSHAAKVWAWGEKRRI